MRSIGRSYTRTSQERRQQQNDRQREVRRSRQDSRQEGLRGRLLNGNVPAEFAEQTRERVPVHRDRDAEVQRPLPRRE